MSWTDERVDLLRKLWTDGLSASQIAAELGGVTRNAVIGKVHRLGMSGRAKGSNQSSASLKKHAAPRTGNFSKSAKASAKQATSNSQTSSSTPRAAPVVDVPKPVLRMISLLELTEQTCKFPIGDPQEEGFGFCGVQSRDNDPYCEYHCRLVYQPASDRRRDKSARTQGQITAQAASSGLGARPNF
jgi:GcrA cell cycle regulator